MELLWFYIAIVLAISDIIHDKLMWNVINDFYVLFAGFINEVVSSPIQAWIVHESIEAFFHFVVLSLVFFSLEIGILAALIHLFIDMFHTLFTEGMNTIEHRAFHFVVESLFFILIFGF
ncbi:MAG: hypothetical protein LBR24_01475 [Methanobrevibacter sp.]|jgi:hypothetical protein|nr:hypothetical protein [Methanobrevibacter sp.]